MDDIDLIRIVLKHDEKEGEPGRNAGRLRLERAIAADGGKDVPANRRRSFVLAFGGLAAAAVGVALAVMLGVRPVPTPSTPSNSAVTPPTAQEFLLAAATTTVQKSENRGRYWHTRWDMRHQLAQQPPDVRVAEQWQAAEPSDQSWSSFVQVPDGFYRPEVRKADRIGYGWEAEFSAAEVRALPAEVGAFRAVLTTKQYQHRYDLPPLETYLFRATVGLLARAPATPAQLATGYRLLATLPNVELVGTATDEDGRSGLLLRHKGESTDDVLIDDASYQVLATFSEGPKMTSQTVYKIREWTDNAPAAGVDR
jgi:hypothetical protein